MADNMQTQLVLAQNQHAFIQDATKGTVQVYSGPHASSLSPNDRPVVYDRAKDEFVQVTQQQAIKQNPLVPEGHYIVLENPAFDGENLIQPKQGINSPRDLKVGRKIVIAGPATFPLWPGQFSESIPGHHIRTNQYLIIRVYNADEATKNAPSFLKSTLEEGAKFTPGQKLIIKGTDVSFFIPPTGFEVLKENDSYVREALTLERLEYCILLDENGEKRYEIGPQVVFPVVTEGFMEKGEGNDRDGANPSGGRKSRKFKAIELNDQMGLYIKVIADYKDEVTGKEYKTGDELFITGKEQRIYYLRAEHALIQYDDPTKGYKRERYYGITIPKGEGRYVLDKSAGEIKKVEGPQIFLPDPRNEVIVRRVLDDKTVGLWYPGNLEALTFNQSLRSLAEESTSYLADSVVLSAAADASRGMNRGTQYSKAIASGSFEGDKLTRSGKFTPPPMLTLNTKYDGVPCINVYTGYAVQVVDKSGNRRIEVGPTSLQLEYDESLEVLELSTGKPKTTDTLRRDVYLRVDNNLVSDVVRVETKDMVNLDLKLSYRVNFLREHKDMWFSVENYVKYLCDHMRSLLKASMKKQGVSEVMENSAVLIRDVVLGPKVEKEVRKRFFPENGMEVYDVEVLSVQISDSRIADLLKEAQTKAVSTSITLAADEQNLEATRRRTKITTEIDELNTKVVLRKQELARQVTEAEAETTMKELEAEIAEAARRIQSQVDEQTQQNAIATAQFERAKTNSDYELTLEQYRVALFEKKMTAITPQLVSALQTLGDNAVMASLTAALAPLALHEQQGIAASLDKVFKGSVLEPVLNNLQSRKTAK